MYFCENILNMLNIGNYNNLKVIKILDFGAYLDGDNGKEILLPNRYIPKGLKPGDIRKLLSENLLS